MMLNRSRHTETQTLLARQLGHLLHSGLNYDEAFTRLEEAGDGEFKQEVEALKLDLETGPPRHRKDRRFPTPILTLRKLMSVARDNGGDAASILAHAEEMLGSMGESYRLYWAGMASFLWYITGISLFMFILLVMFSIFVFPQFQDIYANAQTALPAMTQTMIGMLETMRGAFFVLMITIVIGVIIIAYKIRSSMRNIEPLSGFITRLPGLRTLSRNYNSLLLINLSRLLATSGVPIDTALEHVWKLHQPLQDFNGMISSSSNRLNFVLNDDPVWGAVILSRLTGTLHSEIEHLSSQAETIFAEQLSKLREEFTLIAQISVGVVIALLIISLYLPIFKLGSIF